MDGRFESLRTGDPTHIGPYRITGRLGEGGMGSVYLARSRGGRAVAVKVIHQALAGDEEFRRRFTREVNAARRVNGVYTAGVIDADLTGVPPWLATAYVPGPSLDTAVRRHGPWAESFVLALGAGLAEALEEIHAQGITHRDLKPSNVLLAADGPRVIDFGISTTSDVTSSLTRSGVVIGTPAFMAPEQLTGAAITTSVDVFALGSVLAFAATGTGPFQSGTPTDPARLMYRIVNEEPDLNGLPSGLRTLIARCLAKDPAQRPGLPELVRLLGAGSAGTQEYGDRWLPDPVARSVAGGSGRAEPTPDAVHGSEPPLPPRPPTLVDPAAATLGISGTVPSPGPWGTAQQPYRTSTRPYAVKPRGPASWALPVAAVALVAGLLGWLVPKALDGTGTTAASTPTAPALLISPASAEPPASQAPPPAEEAATPGATPSAPALPPVVGDWHGSYFCGQGRTQLVLTISSPGGSALDALFTFSEHPDNPGVPSGSFTMKGTWEDGEMVLLGDRWRSRPEDYLMVDLEARVEGEPVSRIHGTVNDPSCSTFTVIRRV